MATQRTKIYLEGVAIDLDKNIDIDFTYSITDVADFEKRKTTFSETVSIPATAHNNFLFGNYFDFNIQNDYSDLVNNVGVNFNPMKKAFVTVAIDNVEIFAGVLRLLEIKYNGDQMYYECALFGSLGGLFTSIGDKLLTDLSLSDLDHMYSIENIQDTWSDSEAKYVYPLAQYGLGTNETDSTYDVLNFRPAIKCKDVFDRIFDEAGYVYNAEIWDENNLDKLILLNGEETFSGYFDDLSDVSLALTTVYLVDEIAVEQVAYDTSSTLYLEIDQTTGIYSRIKNPGTNPVTVKFNISIDYRTNFETSQYGIISFNIRNDADVDTIKQSESINVYGTGSTTTGTLDLTLQFVLQSGDGFSIDLFADGPLLGPTKFFSILTSSTVEAINSDPNKRLPMVYNCLVKGKSIVSDSMKQSDFIKSIINLLNLYVVQDKGNEFKLTFIPYPDFYSTNQIDWSYKLDYSKGFSIKSSNDFVPRNYIFNYKDDNDYYSKLYKNKYGIGYGNLKYASGNEFSKDDSSIDLIFSLVPIIGNTNHNRLMPAMFDINSDGSYKQIKTNSKLCFYGGIKSSDVSYTIKNYETLLVTESEYPYAGHIYNPFATGDGSLWDICFTAPSEVYFNIDNYPTDNIFKTYYELFVASQNNKDCKLIELYFLLNSVDIINLDFRDLIKLNNGLYYLNKIDGYNPLNNELTKVELLKII